MSLAKTFYLLKDAELRASELYALIGLSVAITQPELADLFSSLAEDEKLHARQIEMMHTIFLQSPDSFLDGPDAEKTIGDFVQNVETIRNYFNQHFGKMLPADLIGLALDLEKHLVESHSAFFINIQDDSIKKLFAGLHAGNEAHIRKLELFDRIGSGN